MPPKVLFLDQTAQLGGAELCLKDMVLVRKDAYQAADRVVLLQHGPLEDLLRSAGIDTVVYGFSKSSQSIRKDGGLLKKVGSSFDVLQLARAVAREAADMDVIYPNTPKALIVGAMAGWLAGKPVVYHLHDMLTVEHFSWSNLVLMVQTANRLVRHVIANSQSSADAFRAAGGTTPMTICYNGFRRDVFDDHSHNHSMHRKMIRDSIGLPIQTTGQPLVMVFGRYAPWKGQHVAIEALRNLPGVHLALVGDALFGEGDYKSQLITMAADPKLQSRVHFLGFRDDVPALMQAADVVVHCSVAPEPFGRVIVEAMLSKRPVIASSAGGALEIVQDRVNGFTATPGDAPDLANRIREVFELPVAHREQIIAAAYQSALDRFELKAVVEKVNETLRLVVSGQESVVSRQWED
ncbi:MAG: glycosyltransferase family 4 protein [Planctomycetota bacterium]|nr:glycosyltransferase family 4 protein [Planctomycetota bacterium]